MLKRAFKFHEVSLTKSFFNPGLLQSLLYGLLGLRQHIFALPAYIEGLFLQVGFLPKDQPSVCFLWREDPSTEVRVYQYSRI